jgi:hypothetical protein
MKYGSGYCLLLWKNLSSDDRCGIGGGRPVYHFTNQLHVRPFVTKFVCDKILFKKYLCVTSDITDFSLLVYLTNFLNNTCYRVELQGINVVQGAFA